MKRRGHIDRREACAAISRLAALTTAGLSSGEALSSSAKRGGACLARLDTVVRRGSSLSAAMRTPGMPYTEAEVAVVAAGERGGSTARALALLAERMEREAGGRQRIASALAYPVLLVAGGFAALSFLSIAVLPSFTSMYDGKDVELPAVTRALVSFGNTLRVHGVTAFGVLALIGLGFVTARRRSRRVRRWCDRVALDAPPLRALVAPRELHESCSLFALLLDAGCEAEEALGLAARAAGNRIVAERLARALRSLRHGLPLSRAWNAAGLDRSGDATSLLEIAEATGGYASAFSRLAALESAAAEHALGRACRLAEPAAVVTMAVAVGGGVLALYQPMLGSASLLLGGNP